jgi:hypothetical protein
MSLATHTEMQIHLKEMSVPNQDGVTSSKENAGEV